MYEIEILTFVFLQSFTSDSRLLQKVYQITYILIYFKGTFFSRYLVIFVEFIDQLRWSIGNCPSLENTYMVAICCLF